MAPQDLRLDAAVKVAAHPKVLVTGLESRLGTRYTADTIAALRRRFPARRFVWLMGADNLRQMPRWNHWQRIFETVPVAVFDRSPYSHNALAGMAARRFEQMRRPAQRAADWRRRKPPPGSSCIKSAIPHRPPPSGARANRPLPKHKDLTMEPKAISAQPLPLQPLDPDMVASTVTTSLDDDKAEDVMLVDLRGQSSIADHIVIATGKSQRQVVAMADHLQEKLKKLGLPVSVEGVPQGDWVLIDAGDIVVHLFRPEVRSFYGLERMWGLKTPERAEPMMAPLD